MGSRMSLACTSDKNWDTLNYERYLTIATSIGNDNPYSFACFSALNEAQQNLLISQTIAAGFSGTTNAPIRGQAGRQTNGTVTGLSIGAYKTTGLVATFDSTIASGMSLGTTDTFALKNTSGATRILRFFASYDGDCGNNRVLGLKLALNGTPIDASECRAATGQATSFAKLVTSLIIPVDPDDEVALFVANFSGTQNIDLNRGRILATSVD
jgi:hypothetical protein